MIVIHKIGVSRNMKELSKTVSLIVAATFCSWTPALCAAQQVGPGFYVATSGSDNNPGTLAQPFATFRKAQQAMQASSTIKTTYIRGGTYRQSVSVNGNTYGIYLTSADKGETWSCYPPDGYDSAILDGGSSRSGTGINEMIAIDGGSNVTINGLQLQNFDWIGIGVHGGGAYLQNFPVPAYTANGNIIENNIVKNGYGGSAEAFDLFNNAGISVAMNAPNTTVTNNVIVNQNGRGISFITGVFGSGASISGARITNNVLLNSNTLNADSAAIYLQNNDGSSTNILVSNNFIRDYGTSSDRRKGICLDDGLSNAIVSGNIVSGVGFSAFIYHGGSNDLITGNIVDLESSGDEIILSYQPSANISSMDNNRFTKNIIISAGGAGTYKSWAIVPGTSVLTVTNNAYYNYGGSQVSSGCSGDTSKMCISDANPVTENPQLSGWTYKINPGSPVFNPPVNFPGIIGNWGPPGYVVPQTGTPPSSPH